MSISDSFNQFAKATARWCGHPATFVFSLLLCIVWAAVGPIFHFSDTWQLVINTATTVLTFLVVFLIQNTQNRDAAAMQLKLDELIRAVSGARNRMVNLEDVTDAELEQLRGRFAALGAEARSRPSHEAEAPEGNDRP